MSWRRGQAYSQDLRDRVLATPGPSARVAKQFSVSVSYVEKVRRRRRRLSESTPGAQCNHMPRKLAALDGAIAARVAADPHQTIERLRRWAATEHGVQVARATMYKAIARLGLTLKK